MVGRAVYRPRGGVTPPPGRACSLGRAVVPVGCLTPHPYHPGRRGCRSVRGALHRGRPTHRASARKGWCRRPPPVGAGRQRG